MKLKQVVCRNQHGKRLCVIVKNRNREFLASWLRHIKTHLPNKQRGILAPLKMLRQCHSRELTKNGACGLDIPKLTHVIKDDTYPPPWIQYFQTASKFIHVTVGCVVCLLMCSNIKDKLPMKVVVTHTSLHANSSFCIRCKALSDLESLCWLRYQRGK